MYVRSHSPSRLLAGTVLAGTVLAADDRGDWSVDGPTTAGAVGQEQAAAGPDPAAGAAEGLLALLDATDLGDLSEEALRSRVRLLARVGGAVEVARAATLAALDEAGGRRADGASSLIGWVAAQTGQSHSGAARTVRLGTGLVELPATRQALAAGDLSAEAADVIVLAARDGQLGPPDQVEATLLPVALAEGPEALRRRVRRLTQEADPSALLTDERRQQALRSFRLTRRADGMWNSAGLLPSETGEHLRTLLDVFDLPDPPETAPEQCRRPDQRLADALHTAAQVALSCAKLPASGGMTRPHVSVVVDLATFDADLAHPDDPDRPVAPDDPVWSSLPPAETGWGGLLSPQAVRRICCDAGVSRVVTAGTPQPLDLGRTTRVWSAPQRRAIAVRDGRCRGPNCDRPMAWTEIHHVRWWKRDRGRTDVDNGIALCHACHQLVHDRGWHLALDPATAIATWTSPNRARIVVTHPRQRQPG